MDIKGENKAKKENYVENDYAEIWIEDGIVMQVFKPHIKKITLEMGKQMVKDRLIAMSGVSRPLFVDTMNAIDMDKEVRDYFVSPESIQYINASAFLIHNYLTFLGAKLFVGFTKSPVKTEFFKTRSQALKWLEPFKNIN